MKDHYKKDLSSTCPVCGYWHGPDYDGDQIEFWPWYDNEYPEKLLCHICELIVDKYCFKCENYGSNLCRDCKHKKEKADE